MDDQYFVFMFELIRVYGDMNNPKNRDKAFPNSGMCDRKQFDAICAAYYAQQAKKK